MLELVSGAKECTKIYIIDTNVPMCDSRALKNLTKDPENLVVECPSVIEELDRHGKEFAVREFFRQQDSITEHANGNVSRGIRMGSKRGFFLIDPRDIDVKELSSELSESKVDNKIIALAHRWKMETGKRVILISRDKAVRIKARAFGIEAENYKSDMVINNIAELYSGKIPIKLDNAEAERVINASVTNESIPGSFLKKSVDVSTLIPNECCYLEYPEIDYDILSMFIKSEKSFRFIKAPAPNINKNHGKIMPVNPEQSFLPGGFILNPNIAAGTVWGIAGTGKTMLLISISLDAVLSGHFRKLIVIRPLVEVGGEVNSLGFLPGNEEEKLGPWAEPILDIISVYFERNIRNHKSKKSSQPVFDSKDPSAFTNAKDFIAYLRNNELLEIKAGIHLRGWNLRNAIVLLDEAQNTTRDMVKTLATRMSGEKGGFKVIFSGDIEQIDHKFVDWNTNGLTHMIQKSRGREDHFNINLVKVERSDYAAWATKAL